MKKILPLFVALILCSIILVGCGSQPAETAPASSLDRPQPPAEYADKVSPKLSAADLETGMNKYRINCASCHGETGMGDGPAATALDPKPEPLATTSAELSDAYLFWRISEGGMMAPFNSSMPAWKTLLSEEEIWQITGYLRSLEP